jgi:hypothetical protein
MIVRRNSADGELLQVVIIRRPTPIDIVSATATRRDVFTIMPAGFAAVAASDMTLRIPAAGLIEHASGDRAWWRIPEGFLTAGDREIGKNTYVSSGRPDPVRE